MDVPVFPAPPTLEVARRTLGKLPDVRTIGRTGFSRRPPPPPPQLPQPRLSGGRVSRGLPDDPRNSLNARNNQRRRSHRIGRFVNSIHPKRDATIGKNRARVTELRVRMTKRREEDEDDADVVCASVTPVSAESRTISEDLSVRVKEERAAEVVEEEEERRRDRRQRRQPGRRPVRTTGVQTNRVDGPYRLKVLPSLRDIAPEDTDGIPKRISRIRWHLRFFGRLSLCQFGLAWLLTLWTMAGAAAFYATEGPREREQVLELKDMQRDLAVGLATELRQLRAKEQEMEPLWSNKVRQYVAKHEKLLLAAVTSGYGEGGNGGQLWTFPGCVLFSISLVTTLGFGAPVPRTTPGRTVAVIFAAIGIPAHFLLVLNLGLLLAMRLQRYALRRRYNPEVETFEVSPAVPKWVKAVPFCCIGGYYSVGVMCFGVARSRPFAASLLFPLDFTAAGGLATTSGLVRITYGVYLEGAVTIAAVAVAVLRVSATQSLTNIGLKYGLLTEA